MSGNRKHGFMRGSRAGRNGFGQPKCFYCEACEKTHSASVEKVGVTRLFEGKLEAFVCNRAYLKYHDERFQFSTEPSSFIARLKRLKPKIRLGNLLGRKARITFLCLVYQAGLKSDLNDYSLFDEHGIGERDYDTCLEMHDCEDVIHGVIEKCKKSLHLKLSFISILGQDTYDNWVTVHATLERQSQQALLAM